MRITIAMFALAAALVPATAFAHGDCEEDADCEGEQICFEEACSDPCSSDDECAEGEACTDDTACQHVEEDSGSCSAAPSDPGLGFSVFGVALVAAGVRAVRGRRRRGRN